MSSMTYCGSNLCIYMIRRTARSTPLKSSAASDVYRRRDGYTPETTQRGKGLAKQLGHLIGPCLVAIGEGFQIGAGGIELLALPGHHQGKDVPVFVQFIDDFRQGNQGILRPGVSRWIIDSPYRDGSAFFELNSGNTLPGS